MTDGHPLTRRAVLRSGAGAVVGGMGAVGTAAAAGDESQAPPWEDELPDDAQYLGDGRAAIPLKRPPPEWFTDEIKRKTAEAADHGMAYDMANDVRVPPTQYDAIRPGTWMVSPNWCTLNFVYNGGDYIGTAGHCVPDGNEKVMVVIAPNVTLTIGEVVEKKNPGIGCDWALIKVWKEFTDLLKPTTALIGGPQEGSQAKPPNSTEYIGHGVGVGTGGTPRTGVYTRNEDIDIQDQTDGCPNDAFLMEGVISKGDSGSPVLTHGLPGTDSQPVGIITSIVVGTQPGLVAGTRIDDVLNDSTKANSVRIGEWDPTNPI